MVVSLEEFSFVCYPLIQIMVFFACEGDCYNYVREYNGAGYGWYTCYSYTIYITDWIRLVE